jgi:hypothetical protein
MGKDAKVVVLIDYGTQESSIEEMLVAFTPLVDRFSQWMAEHTIVPQPLIRSERELIRQFLLWLAGGGHAESQTDSEDQDTSHQDSDR